MANHSPFPGDGNNCGSFYSHVSLSASDPGSYGSSRAMGPPLDYPPQTLEIDVNPRVLPSLGLPRNWDQPLLQSSGLGDIPSAYASSGLIKNQHLPPDNINRAVHQDPILSWYTGNDGPWIPKGVLTGEKGLPRHDDNRAVVPFGGQYRQVNLSEAGTSQYGVPPSDSGYGTRRSVGTASVFAGDTADRDQDCQSLAGHMGEYSAFQGLDVMQQHDIRTHDSWTQPVPGFPTQESSGLYCSTCRKFVKTKSELKKHHQRHTRPFVCEVAGCDRKDGFSTRNDLDRHMKSKHPDASTTSNTKSYRCNVSGCKSKDKLWPRLDNFRSHLHRVHLLQDGELDAIAQQCEYRDRPDVSIKEQEPEDSPDHSVPQPWEADPHYSTQPRFSSHGRSWSGIETNDAQIPLADVKRPCPEDVESEPAIHGHDILKPQQPPDTIQLKEICESRLGLDEISTKPSGFADATIRDINCPDSDIKGGKRGANTQNLRGPAFSILVAGQTNITVAVANHLPSSVKRMHEDQDDKSEGDSKILQPGSKSEVAGESTNNNEPRKDSDVLKALRLLQDEGYIVQNPPHPVPKINSGSLASNKSEHQVICSVCHKFKGRRCELRKHMKRHERPYGCTFLTCNKSFGSKNDWKRHENSQHFQLETWRCNEERPEGGSCAKVCYRRQVFKEHLLKDHQISENITNEHLEKCRIGRRCQERFWCGFCNRLIELKKKGLDAWAERFNHIDDHFMGRNGECERRISDWIPVDSNEPKGDRLESLDVSPRIEDESDTSSGASFASKESVDDRVCDDKKRAASETGSDRPRKRQIKASTLITIVTCCQCKVEHTELNEHCTICNDGHQFCQNCERKRKENWDSL